MLLGSIKQVQSVWPALCHANHVRSLLRIALLVIQAATSPPINVYVHQDSILTDLSVRLAIQPVLFVQQQIVTVQVVILLITPTSVGVHAFALMVFINTILVIFV